MYVYVNVCMQMCIHVCACMCECMRKYVRRYVCKYVCIYSVCMQNYACLSVYFYVYFYVYNVSLYLYSWSITVKQWLYYCWGSPPWCSRFIDSFYSACLQFISLTECFLLNIISALILYLLCTNVSILTSSRATCIAP